LAVLASDAIDGPQQTGTAEAVERTMVELHRDWAVVVLVENGSEGILKGGAPDADNFRLPWMERETT
jgi:hypothetical protein